MIYRCLFLLVLLASVVRAETAPGTLRVRLTGLKSDDGVAHVSLYDSEQGFDDRKPVREADLPITNGAAEWVVEGLPRGGYAVRAYHDENGNGKLDRSPMGIPDEPIGFSNNARSRFGPPVYGEMEFLLSDSAATIEITPGRMLTTASQFGVGAVLIYSESPYKGGGYQFWPIPSLTYMGRRLSIFGPRISYMLTGSDQLSLSAAGQVRFRSLNPDDSEDLEGMEERNPTFEVGLRLRWRGPRKIEAGVGAMTDTLGEHDGQDISFDLSRAFRFDDWSISPSFGVLWQSANLSDYYYGVRENEVRAGRPQYEPGATWTCGPNLGITYQGLDPWMLVTSVGLEYLDSGITDSPVVDQHVLFRGFLGISRQLGPGAAR